MNDKKMWKKLFPNENISHNNRNIVYDYFKKFYPKDDYYSYLKSFSDINQNYDWEKFIKNFIPLSIINKHNSNSFPDSLLQTKKKSYPIPGTSYDQKPSKILTEFKISVSKTESFLAKFKDIFKESTIIFQSMRQSNRWLNGPNFSYWPQQLNFAVWCATSGCGLSLNEDFPVRIQEFINFHVYFTISRILWKLKIPLPGDKVFNQTSNYFDKNEYLSLCQEFNIDSNSDFRFRGGKNHGLGTIFVDGGIPPLAAGLINWPNSTPIFHDEHGIGFLEGKIINLANKGKPFEWFTPIEGNGLTKAGLGRLNQSIETFVYCIVGAEVNMRTSIADGGGGGVNTQREMIRLFEKAVILDDLPKSVQRYQLAIQEAKLKINYAFAPNIWMIPSNMVINTESVTGYNNFLKKANADMVFGENKLINNEIKKVGVSHNLGVYKTILPHIVHSDHSNHIDHNDNTDSTDHIDHTDSSQFTNIKTKPQTSYSSHDLNKTTLIIIVGIVSYMIFR